jgi:hypothetical protein
MILTKEVNIFINNKVIGYYRGAGYDIVPNSVNCIKVKDLLKNSTARIDVKCYICGFEKNVSYQKYNKNIEKYNIYTCNSSCAQFKNKLTLKKLYGSDNFNRSEENKIKVKEKYDRITKELEERGYIEAKELYSSVPTEELIKHLDESLSNTHILDILRNNQNKINERNFSFVFYN